jgi:imidazolonepropionase-like amidohydrolase
MATGASPSDWKVAREVSAPITLHVRGQNSLAPVRDVLGSDVTYIHCNDLAESDWQMIESSGGHVSIACPIEMEMGHGIPPIQEAINHGIRPSISTDVETQMPADLFTQMRSVFTLQRMLALARERAGEPNPPRLLTVREVLSFATIEGAKVNALDRKAGTLTPGKEADNVDTVVIGGKIVKREGKLVGVDQERIRRQVHQSRDYLVEKAGWPKTLFGGYLPGH